MTIFDIAFAFNLGWACWNLKNTTRNLEVAKGNVRAARMNRRTWNVIRKAILSVADAVSTEGESRLVSTPTDEFRADAEEHLRG